MSANKKILVLPGDGIGPEVMTEVNRVIDWMANRRDIHFDVTEDLVGGACYDVHGCSLTEETLQLARDSDAILFGAVGGPQWDNVAREHRPEAGLLTLRKELDLFANLRPATCMPALAEASSLKTELVSGLDMLIVRELTSGCYFGEPKHIEDLPDDSKRAVDTQAYTTAEIDRTVRIAMELAGKRGSKVHCAHKSNVMETGVLWRDVSIEVGKDFPEIDLHQVLADNCAMQLVREPKQFDVIVTDNLFGDILSDCAAMLTGSLGMLPSASLGPVDANGTRKAMYEPVHGSAPDIVGEGKANPLATILSFSMMLRYSFDMSVEADLVEQAVANVLAGGLRTGDIMQPGKAKVSTAVMGEAIINELDKLTA